MHAIEKMFREKILAENFSCVGAKTSINGSVAKINLDQERSYFGRTYAARP